MKIFAALAGLITICTSTVLLMGTPASAASIFDNTYNQTETFEVVKSGCTTTDFSSNWIEMATNPDTYHGAEIDRNMWATDASNAINATLESSTGSIAMVEYNSYWGKGARVLLSEAPMEVVFTSESWSPFYKYAKVNTDDVFVIDFELSGGAQGCDKFISPSTSGSNNYVDMYDANGWVGSSMPIISTDPAGHWGSMEIKNYANMRVNFVEYPTDYEGDDVDNSLEIVPDEPEIAKPTIAGGVVDKQLTLYSPANTYLDGTSLNGLYKIKWIIGEGDVGCNPETMVCEALNFLEGETDPDETVVVDVVKRGTWYAQAIYVDLNGVPWEDTASTDFQIGERRIVIDGSSYNFDTSTEECDEYGNCGNVIANFENCLNADFPYLHVDECKQNFMYMTSLLSFNKIHFPNWQIESSGCRNLQKIGDWLNTPNMQVCPNFSEDVRDTITPFVTFLLGIVTVGLLVNKTSRESL